MAARPISKTRFAEAVQDRLLDTHQVMEMLGVRSRTTIANMVAAGTLPAPILKVERVYSLWDRLAIESHTRR